METPTWKWIALWPVPLPAHVFADDEVFHLSQGIACPGAHHRDYGTAYIAHDAACPGLHLTAPVTSRGASVLWRRATRRLRRPESEL
ncbi:DUF6083 domain-containing protein [Streptomyces sp. NRRL F-5630]|uniref:DUF6083 domain-containing protein n=1 Tax=Streptomyces sp. NRRL F-5630 TaxID=1463864 RepID=UPI003D7572C3